MDVVCGRCRAEYEFDDALISERGTMVRCTNCGLEFKVFPPVGQSAPEIWSVFDPANQEVPLAEFDSLKALQKAIGAKKVTARHLLSRGGEPPRALADIVELEPLLGPVEGDTAALGPPGQASQSRTGTVLGIHRRADPAGRRADPPPRFDEQAEEEEFSTQEPFDDGRSPGTDVDSQAVVPAAPDLKDDPAELAERRSAEGDVDPETAVVPSEPPDPLSDPEAAGVDEHPAPAKPRIRSALSYSPHEDDAPSSVLSRRGAFSQTLAGGLAPPSEPVASGPGAEVADPPASSGRPASASPWLPPGSPTPGSPTQASEPAPAPEDDARPRWKVGGQLTPTPLAMRAVTSVDSEVTAPIAEAPARRRATGLVLIVSVVLGGAGVAAWNQRERLVKETDSRDESAERPVELERELRRAVDASDIEWWRARIDGESPPPDPARLESLVRRVEEAGGEVTWAMVNLQRMLGKLESARRLAALLPRSAGAAYALATIDLSEEGEPPWPLLLERLEEASTGERAPFLARAGRILGLLESGDGARARAEFEAFGRLSGARESALYEPLKTRLQRASAETDDGSTSDPVSDAARIEAQGAESAPGDGALPAAEKGSASPRTEASPEPQPSRPGRAEEKASSSPSPERPKGEQERASEEDAKSPPVSEALQQKVAEADALWRSGERDGAVALYREVVDEIGTSHFLGQRSAARVALAEREKAAAAQRSADETPE